MKPIFNSVFLVLFLSVLLSPAISALALDKPQATQTVTDQRNHSSGEYGCTYTIESDLAARKLVVDIIPTYPDWAKEQKIETTTKIEITVLPNGHLSNHILQLEQTSGYQDLDQAVCDALYKCVFAPLPPAVAQTNQTGIITFHFGLKNGTGCPGQEKPANLEFGPGGPVTVRTTAEYMPESSEPLGKACTDEEIYNLCNQFLIKQFGAQWAKNYKPYRLSGGIEKDEFTYVLYGFTGPANLKKLCYKFYNTENNFAAFGKGPGFTIRFDGNPKSGCKQLNLVDGSNFVAPYDSSKLITVEIATQIAKRNGHNDQFGPLTLIPSHQMFGRLSLLVPGYEGDKGINVNAIDGSISKYEPPMSPPRSYP